MKWTYVVEQKLKLATVLVIVFGLIFSINRMDKTYFSELQNSFTSLYQDRLLAESYIYQLSGLLFQKKVLDSSDERINEEWQQKQLLLNDSLNTLIADYGETKLTEAEAHLFAEFQQGIFSLKVLENQYRHEASVSSQQKLAVQYQALTSLLDRLSRIQLTETANIVARSNQVIASSNTISRLEICLLIVIGLLAQALIFASKSEVPRFSQNYRLN
jgi:hypothetical protein